MPIWKKDNWRIREELPNYFLDYRQQTSADTRWQNRVTSSDGDWSGNVYDFFFRTYNLMKQSLKTPFQMKGIERVDDTPAHRALREALANARTARSSHSRWETIPQLARSRRTQATALPPGSPTSGSTTERRRRSRLPRNTDRSRRASSPQRRGLGREPPLRCSRA